MRLCGDGGLGLGAQGEDLVSLGWEESRLISEAGGLWRLLLLLGELGRAGAAGGTDISTEGWAVGGGLICLTPSALSVPT